jgi:hypothetical protein
MIMPVCFATDLKRIFDDIERIRKMAKRPKGLRTKQRIQEGRM